MTQAPTPGPLDSESVGCAETPLQDLLRRVPKDAVLRWEIPEEGRALWQLGSASSPVGSLMHRAADQLDAFRPQPSGETRALLERIAAVRARKDFTPQQANAGLLTVLDDCAAALALGGQQGVGEGFHSNLLSHEDNEAWAALSTTPARAEAQDEGAAGEPVAYGADHQPWCQPGDQTDRAFRLRFEDPDMREMIWTGPDAEKEALAAYNQYAPSWNVYLFSGHPRAHPSPTPAADADRVRDLVAAAEGAQSVLNAVAAERRKIGPIATKAQSLVWQLKAALAALKSTAAKEGGEV